MDDDTARKILQDEVLLARQRLTETSVQLDSAVQGILTGSSSSDARSEVRRQITKVGQARAAFLDAFRNLNAFMIAHEIPAELNEIERKAAGSDFREPSDREKAG